LVHAHATDQSGRTAQWIATVDDALAGHAASPVGAAAPAGGAAHRKTTVISPERVDGSLTKSSMATARRGGVVAPSAAADPSAGLTVTLGGGKA